MLRAYQSDIVTRCHAAWDAGLQNVMPVCATGSGKCLGRGTPVLMYDGTIRAVEDVRVGDRLMGPDSQPRLVRSLARGRETLYRVTPTKGDSYVVNASHILSLQHTVTHEVVNIDVRTYMAQNNTFKHCHKGWRVGVDFPSTVQLVDMPPYMLGIWLGDGSSKSPCVTTADPEVVEAIYSYAADIGHEVAIDNSNCGKAEMYRVTSRIMRKSSNRMTGALRQLGVWGNKHIPHNYLCASREKRLELLAGILDSDGHLSNGYYDAIFKSERLANDIVYLARSLGFASYVKPAFKRATNSAHTGGIYFRLSIAGDVGLIPTRLARHQCPPRRQIKNVLRTGIEVTKLTVGDYFGFDIDGDRLFLLGDFTVTHNTKIMSHVAAQHDGAGIALAHRSVLVGQISMALAAEGVRHDIIAPKKVVQTIVKAQIDELGANYYTPGAMWKVASVDTMPGRAHEHSAWIKRVTLGFTDEAHHVLANNKWGRECNRFENARWLLPTATPERGDGKGLGRDYDGIADTIVEGPPMRWLINNGYLTDYVIRAPLPADLDLSDVQVGANGEYNLNQLRKAVHRSTKIVGNVVDTYLEHTAGKLGIVFGVDIEHARELTKEFLAKGVTAELITAEDDESRRREILRRYRNRETLVLVNVDLFGEGFDLPAIEVVMFARPTASYSLYAQMFGRGLRLLIDKLYMQQWESYTPEQRLAVIAGSSKPVAHIHDHVGNVLHFFGPPDKPREWSLETRAGRRSGPSDAIPLRVCLNPMCMNPFERFYTACPMCGFPVPPPAGTSLPEQVDGDIHLYTPEMLRALFNVDSVEAALQMKPNTFCQIPPGVPPIAVRGIQNRHAAKLAEQHRLTELMPLVMPPVLGERENNRKFFLQYGVDVVRARTLGQAETAALNEKIMGVLTRNR